MASRIEIQRGVDEVFRVWTDVAAYPRFMPHVDRVAPDGGRLRVTSTIDGLTRSWYAEVIERVPNQTLAWRALDESENGGRVELRARGEDRTEVTLYLQIDHRQFAHHRGDGRAIGERIEGEALAALRELMEGNSAHSLPRSPGRPDATIELRARERLRSGRGAGT